MSAHPENGLLSGGVLLAYVMHYGAHLLLLPGHAHLTSQHFSSVLRIESHPPKPVKSVFWLPPAHSFGIVPVCSLFICTISVLTERGAPPSTCTQGIGRTALRDVLRHWQVGSPVAGHWWRALCCLGVDDPKCASVCLFFNISRLCIICFYFCCIFSASH